MILNYFKKIYNFIFIEKIIKEKEIKNILKNRVIYFPQTKKIIFFPYQNKIIKKHILSMKFNNNFKIANFFGEIIYDNLPNLLENLKIEENFHNPIIINIPLSFQKKISRGYNQNDLIIKKFSNLGGKKFIRWEQNILKKIKNTKPQSKIKDKKKRLKNIEKSFGLKNPQKIKGKNIILFDDVTTTGATLNEAKKILKKTGAKKIILMALAH